jgi:hypothetical protein
MEDGMEANGNGHGKAIEEKVEAARTDEAIIADLLAVLNYVGDECREIAKSMLVLEEAVKRAIERTKK